MMQGKVLSGQAPSTSFRLDHDVRKLQAAKACAKLIAERGYADTSIRDVAAEMGISTGTLLHHFASKEELLTATLSLVADDFLARMRQAAAKVPEPVERLRAVVRALLGKSKQADIGWRVWIAFWHEAAINPQLARVAGDITDESEGLLTDWIADGVSQGSLKCEDPRKRASELAALIDGVAIRLYGETGRWSHDRAVALVDELIRDLIV